MTYDPYVLTTEQKSTIEFYRGLVLEAVEREVGDSPNWRSLRSRLLSLFGDKGLEGRLLDLTKRYGGFDEFSI